MGQIKDVASAIRVDGRVIWDSKIVSKVLRTLFPMYAIKFFTIQEVRAMPCHLKLDGLVG